ncbi:hypothetical protein LUZ60_015599 [Juncus effusus]|nr:hypothetical protein LUZ60_015599 [Juncus effusus]
MEPWLQLKNLQWLQLENHQWLRMENHQWLQNIEWPSIYRSGVISFRAIALILLALAAQRMGTASQEVKVSSMSLGSVTFSDYTAYVYFVSINIIACISSAILLLACLYKKDNTKWVQTLLASIDIIMISLLFSAIGAAFSVYTISYNGLSVQIFSWVVMCGTLSSFCSQVIISISISICGSVAYMIAIVCNHLDYLIVGE